MAIDIGRLYLNYSSYPVSFKFFYDLIFAFLAILALASPFLIRFTNIFYSIGWLFLSLLYIIEADRAISAVAFFLFLSYHIIRYFFRTKYNREFIPPNLGRGWSIDQYNELEGRSSGTEDANYLKLFVWIAAVILLGCLFLSGKKA